MSETCKVLITVKTYPVPSRKYKELVCTAGLRENGDWIRLYPIDFRYRPFYKWYKKYQWIEIEVDKNVDDDRPESFRPNLETLRLLGEPINTSNGWHIRKQTVLRKIASSIEELSEQGKSLGTIKPAEISDVEIEEDSEKWSPARERDFVQLKLFGPQQKPLKKIPFKFRYVFKCNDNRCKGHKLLIEDWEIGALYLTMFEKYKNKNTAANKVKDKLLEMCHSSRDCYFFVGTSTPYKTFLILGVFWPPSAKFK